ncbi:oxygenase MpaB family protein [Nocardia suismassiliense]|uniref:oxygenase MpaB family protein n=1 Tax=Nocardia suismassiliense TaxID=2077092 RepID=UPI000D1E6FF0|nr:oxygenase MpaB family protein [Nocardia suismassiliense]
MQFDPTTLRRDDYGFFGPDSPSWKVWTAPTAVIGFQRAVVLEHFDPFLTAAVADSRGIYSDPRKRLDHTFSYFLIAAIADGRTAIQAAEHLMRIHAPMTGIEPISGNRYSANSPETQLWIHITGWHSVLKAYEVFGPGLTPEEETRFWQECAIAAELQTCKPEDVPRSRDEVRAYFERVRPRLCTSERAEEGMHHLLWTSPRNGAGLSYAIGSRLLSLASVATLPKWMRKLGRFDRLGIVDLAVRLPAKVLVWGFSRFNSFGLLVAAPFVAPMAGQILKEHINAEPPARLETVTPAEARARYGRSGRAELVAEPA